jgi:hypothetical protein
MMKKLFTSFGIVVFAYILLSAGAYKLPVLNAVRVPKRTCIGFTVVEAGKGVNCYGDTILLTKTNGFYSASSVTHQY